MRKGQKISEETRKKISESKKKNYSDSGEDIKSKFRQSFTKEKRILAREKSKQTCLDRYGVENVSQLEDTKEKSKQTCLDRYGVEYYSHTFNFKEKIKNYYLNYSKEEHCKKTKQGCFKRYGVEFASQMKSFQDNRRQTCLDRYGVDSYTQTPAFKEKSKQTCLDRYGVENANQSETIKEKVKQTFIEKYGGFTFESSQLREKFKQTCLDRYGVENVSQKHLIDCLPDLQSQEWWNQHSSFIEVKNELNSYLSLSQIYLYAHQYRPDWNFCSSISSPHQQVISFLIKHQIEYEINTRKVITPLELDIYIPRYNLAIEVNGVYWHSELQGKDKNYHLNKTLECEKQDIHLLQFWDFEIEHKWEIISSMILAKCGIYQQKVGARKCLIKEVDSKTEKEFLNQNHLQGYRPSSLCYGLFYHDELVSLMSFSKPRFNKNVSWELLRFCNKTNTQVIGGASRLFKQRPEGSLVSYADRRYSDGNLYTHLGFSFKKNNSPSYYYTNNFKTFYNRVKFQKHKLSTLLESFDPAITEWENMKANGYDRIWDCGSLTFYIEGIKL